MQESTNLGFSRRHVLGAGVATAFGSLAGSHLLAADAPAAAAAPSKSPFVYCLNTSTVRGANLSIMETLDIAAKVGFTALEPWISEIEAHQKKGGAIEDIGKKCKDLGLTVESVIGFAKWIVDDDAERAKGLEQMKRDMDLTAKIGGTRIAAPAVGAQNADAPLIDLAKAAERYRAVLELGDQTGVVPQVEVWGFSKNIKRLSEAAYVAIAAGHPKSCVLADVYHLHKGGSDPLSLRLLSGQSMHAIHFNDYPADPPRDTITDAHRIFPGDGVAPLDQILRILRDIGFKGALSLELFNRDYWKQSPVKIAQTGIDKMRAAVAKAFA